MERKMSLLSLVLIHCIPWLLQGYICLLFLLKHFTPVGDVVNVVPLSPQFNFMSVLLYVVCSLHQKLTTLAK